MAHFARALSRATLAILASASLSAPGAAQFRIERFTTSNGLPQNTVSAIAQTSDGYLWLATYDGIARYDGVRFTVFDRTNTPAITSTQFLSLFEDSRHTLWIGSVEGGLLRYRDGRFTSFTKANGLLDDWVGRIQESSRGLLLFYSDKVGDGLWLPTNASAAADDAVKGDFLSPSGARWIRTDRSVSETRGGRTTAYDAAIDAEDFARFRVETSDSALWVGSRGSGLVRLAHGTVTRYDSAAGVPPGERIKVAGRDREGHVWIHSDHDVMREEGGRFVPVPLGPQTHAIRAALVDREGTVWVGANTAGLVKISPAFLTSASYVDRDRPRSINGLIEDGDGSVLAAAAPGLLRLAHDSLAPTDMSGSVRSLHRDADGTLWMGGVARLLARRGNRTTDHSAQLGGATIDVITRDRSGTLWAGSARGLFRIEPQPRLFTEADGLPKRAVTSIIETHDGTLLVGTSAGIARRDGDRFVPVVNGAPGEHVRTLYEDASGAIWIGTADNGLRRLKGTTLTTYTTGTGLFSNGVFAILEDARGWLWLSSNRGISRVSRRELEDVAAGRRTRVGAVGYGTADGMVTAECNGGFQPAGLRTHDGHFLFPTQEGIVSVDPERSYLDGPPPPLVLEALRVDGTPAELHAGVIIPPGQHDLEIEYTAPSFQKAENVQFRYRLSGVNADWVDAGTSRSVHYARLAPGSYTFMMTAANSEGQWNGAPASIAFEVRPWFWQTRWFTAALILLAVAAGSALSQQRVRRLKAAEARLGALVSERTKELALANGRLSSANRQLEQLATSDALTQLANRRRFNEFLDEEWRRGTRERTPLSLLMIDVDFFKRYNDALGHQAGDDALRGVAEVLASAASRPTDLAARYGGEEFSIVLANTDAGGAAMVAESVRSGVAGLQLPHPRSDAAPHVTVSIGIAVMLPTEDAAPTALIALADAALYSAKESGRNRVATESDGVAGAPR